ncbi:MAG: hypothetical protein IJN63_05735 [Clostridia bacterium]|nr:hypothetical protein [Clostridia bacterium]
MKRIVCLLLCALMLCPMFAGCSKELVGDGAIFEAYVASETFCFDPTYATTDDNSAQYLSLIFEGLTTIDANGKLRYALLDHYNYTQDKLRNEYKLTLYMKKTRWSDAAAVTADDLLFSWKRLLSPDVSATAASLLYDIKNARAAKNSECSIDDVGIASVDTYTLEVTFEYDIDVEAFLRTCASIQLVPLRENVVSRNELTLENWAKRFATLSVNGPFCIRGMDYDNNTLTLQRNNYYFRPEEDDALNKEVQPYKIVLNLVKKDGDEAKGEDLQAQLDRFLNGETLFLGDLPLSKRAEYASKGNVLDTLSTMSLLINCSNELLSDKNVRQALSLAIDRQALADKVVFADPATGLINNLVYDATAKSNFRSVGGALINTTADTAAAKAKAKSGSFTLTYKNTEEFAAVAEYLKSAWESIGFSVTLNPVMSEAYKRTIDDQEFTFYNDVLDTKVKSGDYEVALVDFSMIAPEAFGVLAQFAFGFTGNTCDVENDWAITGHISGFNSEAYNAAIEGAFAEKDHAKRTALLHDCEKLLLDEMPIIPLLFNKSFYMVSDELSDIYHDYFGNVELKSADYKNYVEETEAE